MYTITDEKCSRINQVKMYSIVAKLTNGERFKVRQPIISGNTLPARSICIGRIEAKELDLNQ